MKVEQYQVGAIIQMKVDTGITLWQAIKLRIAGKGYLSIAEKIGDAIVLKLNQPADILINEGK